MLTLNDNDLARLRTELFDLICKHAGELIPDGADEQAWLTAMLQADARLRKAMPEVTKRLEARALRADMSQAAIARARSTTRQSVNKRVTRG